MTELINFLRNLGGEAVGTASALEILLRVTLLLTAALLAAIALRRSSAAVRHLIWALSLVGVLLIPLCYWAFPSWQWAILPQLHPSPATTIASITKDTAPESPVQPGNTPLPFDASAGQFAGGPAMPFGANGEPFAASAPTPRRGRLRRMQQLRNCLPPLRFNPPGPGH